MPEIVNGVSQAEATDGKDTSSDTTSSPESSGENEGAEKASEEKGANLSERRDAIGARLDIAYKHHEATTAGKSEDEIRHAAEKLAADRSEYAKLTLDLWRNGNIEQLSKEDLEVIATDVVESNERSALAELVLSRHGFETAQEALRTLKVDTVEVDGEKFELKDESKWKSFVNSPAVREQIKKLGISGGTSLTVAGVIALVGGPVSWATLGFGIAGGAAGRAIGEGIRGRMLAKEVAKTPESDETEAFKEKVGRDLFELITHIRSSATEINELDSDDPAKIDRLIELVKQANQVESRSQKDYEKMEKNSKFIKGGLSLLGAVGGAVAGSGLAGLAAETNKEAINADWQEAYKKAQDEGVRIFHDASGQAHITLDESQGHVVKQTTDGAWRFVIEQKDINVAMDNNLTDQFHYYLSPEQAAHMEYLQETTGFPFDNAVPSTLPEGGELLHDSTITSVDQSLYAEKFQPLLDKVSADHLYVQWYSNGAVAAGELARMKSGANDTLRAEKRQETIRRDDQALIGSVDEVEGHLKGKMRDNLEKLAFSLGHNGLPENPKGYSVNWEKQGHKLPKGFDVDKLPQWVAIGSDGGAAFNQHGEAKTIGVVDVDPDNNRIAIVRKLTHEKTGGKVWPVDVVSLESFLRMHKQILKEKPGRSNDTGFESSESSGEGDHDPNPDGGKKKRKKRK